MQKDARVEFTQEMKKDYTILAPNMLPVHFELLKNLFISYGYKAKILTNEGQAVLDEGLKYVHNDACYPALLVIGQLMDALHSGKYDLNKTALMITQTGGGCRASNYIHLLRKALVRAGLSHIPVISLNFSGMEKNSGFKITLSMLRKGLAIIAYGDLLMLLNNQTKAYELRSGESQKLVNTWIDRLTQVLAQGKGYSTKDLNHYLAEIADTFAGIRIQKTPKIKVGIVGEIYVKYSSLANNNLEQFLFEQNCETMVPGLTNFMMFKLDNKLEDIKLYGGSGAKLALLNLLMQYFTRIERTVINAVKRHVQFVVPSTYRRIKQLVSGVVGYGNRMGEGWLLTAEMMELIENGYENIVCAQPFGCLPNHIVGKGMIRKIRSLQPKTNIVPIDYDPGATKVNQENRIKLMLAVAKEKLREDEEKKYAMPEHIITV